MNAIDMWNSYIINRKFLSYQDLPIYFFDKLKAYEFVKLNFNLLAPTVLWSGTNPAEVPSTSQPWIGKFNHRSGGTFDRLSMTSDELKDHFDRMLEPYDGIIGGEFGYAFAEPKAIIQERISPSKGQPLDFKFYVFGGKCELIQVNMVIKNELCVNFYDMAGQMCGGMFGYKTFPYSLDNPRLAEMVNVAEELGTDHEFIRVDLLCGDSGIFFGEYTPFPHSGIKEFADNHRISKLLERLDPEVYVVSDLLGKLHAKLQKARANYQNLVQESFSNRMIGTALSKTKAELDATKAELDATKAELDATKAELDATKAELDATLSRRIRSLLLREPQR